MTSTVNVKHRFVLRALKNASAAVLVTSLLSCGGGGGGDNNVVSNTGSKPELPASTSGTVPFTASAAAAAAASWASFGRYTAPRPALIRTGLNCSQNC
jgi:urease alpha subunit